MRTFEKLTDPVFVPGKSYNALERFFLGMINDERDLPFIYLALTINLLFIPAAFVLFTPLLQGWVWWVAASVYLLAVFAFVISPFTLMLHNTSHNNFFKQKYSLLNHWIPWVLGPFMGQSPETYYAHHIGMHHSEANLFDDESSTMPYQRDHIGHFMIYYLRFLFIGLIDTARYFTWKKRYDFVRRMLSGELLFYAMVVGLCFVNWQATLFVFILPFVIMRFGMMAGNWGQHAFVDPKDPANSYLNSITCINVGYNRKCFNDGYHIGHHIKPRLHWTEMPVDFQKNAARYAEAKAIVFEGLDHFLVWFFLMTRRYDILANHIVNINNAWQSDQEVIETMKYRTRLIPQDK